MCGNRCCVSEVAAATYLGADDNSVFIGADFACELENLVRTNDLGNCITRNAPDRYADLYRVRRDTDRTYFVVPYGF